VNRSVSSTRGGFHLVELVVVVIVIAIVIGLMLPARQSMPDGRGESMYRLKVIGIALNSYASANNNRLPSASVANAPFFFSGPKGTAAGPAYQCGLLSFMEGNIKTLVCPDDVNRGTVPDGVACSYSIPLSWTTYDDGNLRLPNSFLRGTSWCIGAAEMTTYGRTYASIQPFEALPYTHTEADAATATANSFYQSGCHVVMIDGSVRRIVPSANTAANWSAACNLEDMNTTFSRDW
jgi:type II secretory pathway pseudopilin PulG